MKRVYELPEESDGYRILVDRLWPRGVSKDKAKVDLWLKEVGPSNELRKWYGHDPLKFNEFKSKYVDELKTNPAYEELKAEVANNKTTTLVYSAHDGEHSQAKVLFEMLSKS